MVGRAKQERTKCRHHKFHIIFIELYYSMGMVVVVWTMPCRSVALRTSSNALCRRCRHTNNNRRQKCPLMLSGCGRFVSNNKSEENIRRQTERWQQCSPQKECEVLLRRPSTQVHDRYGSRVLNHFGSRAR